MGDDCISENIERQKKSNKEMQSKTDLLAADLNKAKIILENANSGLKSSRRSKKSKVERLREVNRKKSKIKNDSSQNSIPIHTEMDHTGPSRDPQSDLGSWESELRDSSTLRVNQRSLGVSTSNPRPVPTQLPSEYFMRRGTIVSQPYRTSRTRNERRLVPRTNPTTHRPGQLVDEIGEDW